eukprot:Skav211867  [mRNA]  locus=scaffold1431:159338:161413:- [translate_table: standard]
MPLPSAARNGSAAALQRLLELRAAVAPKDYEGKTPLDDAKGRGHADVVTLLEVRGRLGRMESNVCSWQWAAALL